MVLGTTLVKAGEPFGYSTQDVYYIAKTVMRWWDKLNALPGKPKPPPGWVTIELVVPRSQVDSARRVVEALYPLPTKQPKERTRIGKSSPAKKLPKSGKKAS